MRAVSRIFGMMCLCCLPLAVLAQTAVESFSPSGTVKKVRQVKVRFSEQMVDFGDMRLADPFNIDCPEAGSGRWIDGSNWSYDFARELPGGVACSFSLKPGLKDAAGRAVAGGAGYRFDTGGPAVVGDRPGERGRIDEQQIFVLALDAVARDDSIAAHAYCRADGINEKIPVRLLDGAERQQALAATRHFVRRHLNDFDAVDGKAGKPAGPAGPQPLAVLQCARTLPADAKMSLVWGAGIAAASGLANREDQVLRYTVRPDFSARFSCDRVNAKAQCIPFRPVTVSFSAPIPRADAEAVALTGPDGQTWRPARRSVEAGRKYVSSVEIDGPFPERTRLTLALPVGLKDDAGRDLLNRARFPMAVRMDEYPPLVKFPARFGIIEARGDRMLPVTVRNVEAGIAARMLKSASAPAVTGSALRVADGQDRQVIAWLARLGGEGSWQPQEMWRNILKKPLLAGADHGPVERFTLPKPGGKRAFEVIGVPLRKPGFYVVELASPILGAALHDVGKVKGGTAYVNAAALVTNMVAHFKHGSASSLVWVTSLDKGRPVAGAQVAVRDCAGQAMWQGVTDGSGVAHIAQALESGKSCKYGGAFFVSARSGGDMTFTLSDWNNGIEPWRFNASTEYLGASNALAATVFDRSLLRAGETVHMKHFLRRHGAGGIELANGALPAEAVLVHEGSEQRYQLPLAWRAGGIAEQTWAIPADAKLGWYQVWLGGETSGRFRVEQFRVPTMKAVLQGPKQDVVQPSQVELDVQVNYLSGGGASGTAAKLRTVLGARSVHFEAYDGFSFSSGDVKEGVVRNGGYEGDYDDGYGGDEAQPDAAAGGAATQNLTLDRAGGARVVIGKLPALQSPQDLQAELSYQDANGETLTASTRIPLWPSSYLIGIKTDSWAMSTDALKFQVAVLDLQGKPVAGAPVAVDFFRSFTYSHRRRLIGGFYAYENSSEVKAVGPACEGATNDKGLLLCQVKAPGSGNLILRARTQDAAQRAAVTKTEAWVAEGEEWWFKASDDDRIDLLPELKSYEPGQSATFQLRMPFREATALVTVEREGVLDTYVRQLSGRQPVFTIPVKSNYAPNVFVSALVVRGRVAGVQPTALVDLGKPAYKLGLAPLRVGWAAHELKVQVGADRQVYKVREQAQVKVRVTRADGSAPPAGAEVALAAVDVGLLELMPNDSWALLENMMRERSLQVETSTAQMQVVGKRHFGRKAVAHGGGGGKGGGRELFDTLLFWKARVALDANGEASVQVPLNDSLTGFRIVAVANAGVGMFGAGSTDIRSSQDLMLLSGLPPLVREGDRFRAGFTLRNATAAELKVKLGAQAGGRALPSQSLAIGAGQAQEVGWDVEVPAGAGELAWDVTAQVDGADGPGTSDRLRIRQKVKPLVPVRTYQATLLQLDQPQTLPVQMPKDALAGRGGVQALFSARLGGDMPGVREYINYYPYTCFEQLVSRAIVLRDADLWRRQAAAMPAHMDRDGLLMYFPGMERGSDSLTAYVLSAVQEAGFEIPAELKERMESGLLAFVRGKAERHSALPMADLTARKLAALEVLSRSRQVAPADIESFAIVPGQWPMSALIDWYLLLQRTEQLPQRAERLAQVQQMLRARLNLQGATMGFSTERSDRWWWLMVSGDSNANRLLLAMLDNPAWQADMGRLARGALGRQRAGHWDTTVANAWGSLAMERFSRKFESVAVQGSSSAAIGSVSKSAELTPQKAVGSVLLPWPRGSAELALRHTGSGKPWVTVQSLAALPLTAPLSSGYRIARTVTPLEQATPGKWSRGDVYRVKLDLEAQADMTWVVVDDPIPSGASILGGGLGGDSQLLNRGEKTAGWVWPVYQERTFEAFRAYYEYVPKGKWSFEYTVRLNNAGQFNLPPTRVEAMYNPEMFGAAPNAAVSVK